MRFVDENEVAGHLTRELAFTAMERAFRLEAQGLAGPSVRTGFAHPGGRVRILAGAVEGLGIYGHKLVAVTEAGVRYPITLFDMATGQTIALLEGDAIGAYRTAATTALATDILCPPAVEVAAIVGTGKVAGHHLEALQVIRPAQSVRVYSRDPARREAFAERYRDIVEIETAGSVDEALEGATLVTLATNSTEPLLEARHLRPGMHVNSVGAVRESLHEIAPDAWSGFDTIACDDVDLVFTHAGDAIATPVDTDDAVSLASLIDRPDRPAGAITLFRSAGTALQDLVLAAEVLERLGGYSTYQR